MGFMSVIPALFAWQGRPVPAAYPASWRVSVEHRGASMPMLVKLRRLSQQMPVVDASPAKHVRVMLEKLGFRPVNERAGMVFLLGGLAGCLSSWFRPLPHLSKNRHLVTNVSGVRRIARPYRHVDKLENWVTPEFIRWRASAPLQTMYFLGCEDAEGTLTSYLMLVEHELKGWPAWQVVDWFTTVEDLHEVLGLLGELGRQPTIFGKARRVAEVPLFAPDDKPWSSAPYFLNLRRAASYYYATPPEMQKCRRRCLIADGDFGM